MIAPDLGAPCNRFLDDGLGAALLKIKGNIRFFW
ncbi:hypothetical protein AU15_11755 [Marinobacter salarius]|uniref:Uncharacterized protein n=1 Tax=Marinobacter salarius TaxID=1420917 RepID=W5YVC0_9GAMM|nr:hypothetical protein AU15_11755 [Marinobacter salarius]